MWNIIVLSILVVVDAGSVEEIYGSWVPVAFYPVTTYVPSCLRVSFVGDSNNNQCTCADGKNATMLEFRVPEQRTEMRGEMFPMLTVNTPSDVAPALNVSCKCGDIEYRSCKVTISVNSNYFVLFEVHNKTPNTQAESSNALIFAREIPTFMELRSALQSIKELVNLNRNTGIMCTQEYLNAELRYKAHRQQDLSQEQRVLPLRVQNGS